MASAGGRADSSLRERLLAEPHRYSFFQAVRLLEVLLPTRRGVGHDGPPRDEIVRFGTEASLTFPASELLEIVESEDGSPHRAIIRFLGLTGPTGALPRHYTELVIARNRKRDSTLHDFLDLFSHRIASLFYRAWEKYRLHLRVRADATDALSMDLFSLFGLGTPGLRRRLAVPDRALLFYTGLLAQRPRSAIGLEAIVSDYFHRIPVRVDQFVGQWLVLDPESLTSLSTFGGNNQLGVSAIAGARVWSTQSRFRLRLGPLRYDDFCGFLPPGDRSAALLDLTRFYVGDALDVEFRLVLRADEVPACQLGSTGPRATRLGWSTWLSSAPRQHHAEDVLLDGGHLAEYHRRQRKDTP